MLLLVVWIKAILSSLPLKACSGLSPFYLSVFITSVGMHTLCAIPRTRSILIPLGSQCCSLNRVPLLTLTPPLSLLQCSQSLANSSLSREAFRIPHPPLRGCSFFLEPRFCLFLSNSIYSSSQKHLLGFFSFLLRMLSLQVKKNACLLKSWIWYQGFMFIYLD